ncbi:helix-turn-helix transcriptional regulator [Trueperella pyogenes]|uniref:helix-turn-helix domain-containing protein n=1 Tax=Trueperella pyogenes TaxID=1661 RepID=UPI00215CFAEA|nr:helix-turn-helix transcriptional regulator [Trueperella pyogenes]UVJ59037.1 helix-turn-helix transcriptional regulator [Trueperella pyogenes]
MESLNAEIRAELGRRRLTYADLARATQQTRQAVQRKLTAERAVSLDDLEKFSSALSVPASELVRRAEKYENSKEVSA